MTVSFAEIKEYEALRTRFLAERETPKDFDWTRFYRLDRQFANVDLVGVLMEMVAAQNIEIECLKAKLVSRAR